MGVDRNGFSSRRVELGPGPINYLEAGEGPPIVFVHGVLANGRLWEEAASELAAEHRCIVPDWPLGSHAEAMSPDADLTPRGIARLVSEFIAELDLDDVTIVGNDSGGAVSQILVTEMPDRIGRLVLTNCDSFEKFPPDEFKSMAKLARIPGAFGLLIQPMRLRSVRRSPRAFGALTVSEVDDEILQSFTRPSVTNAGVRRDGMRFLIGMDPRDTMGAAAKFPQLEIPVLLAWGTDDPFFTLDDARRIAELIPDCRLVEIPGAATFTALDKPVEVAGAIEAFLAESRSPVSGA